MTLLANTVTWYNERKIQQQQQNIYSQKTKDKQTHTYKYGTTQAYISSLK